MISYHIKQIKSQYETLEELFNQHPSVYEGIWEYELRREQQHSDSGFGVDPGTRGAFLTDDGQVYYIYETAGGERILNRLDPITTIHSGNLDLRVRFSDFRVSLTYYLQPGM